MQNRRLSLLSYAVVGAVLCACPRLPAQSASTDGAQPSDVQKNPVVEERPDPLKRRLSDSQRLSQQKKLRNELSDDDKKWINEDVRWIITDQELSAFKQLSNEEEREAFKEAFWQRRNPDPESDHNEALDEHYRRIAYANEHFAAGEPGWKTDRGMIYIKYGKPDDVESHPSGGQYTRPMAEGGGDTVTYAFEIWHYRYIEGVGDNIDIEFVDECMCNEYRMELDRSRKDVFRNQPSIAPTMWEANGKANPTDRMNSTSGEQLGAGPMSATNQSKEFDRLDQFTKLQAPPPIKFKDMEEYMVNSKVLTGPPFDFDVRTDYVKLTSDMVMVPITLLIHNKDVTLTDKDGISTGTVNILGRVTTVAGRPLTPFEDTVKIDDPLELKDQLKGSSSVYWHGLLLAPGLYKIDIVIKDVNRPDHIGHWTRSLIVPKYDDDQLSASSLILARTMERVPTKDIGQGNFVIGNTHIIPGVSTGPTVPVTFHRGQNLNFWMQVYNLGIDQKSKQNGASIEYVLTNLADNKEMSLGEESSAKISPNADQLTLEKSLPLTSVQPGKYKLTIKVNDGVTKQQIASNASFVVE